MKTDIFLDFNPLENEVWEWDYQLVGSKLHPHLTREYCLVGYCILTEGVSSLVGHQNGAGSFSVPFVPITMASLGSSKFVEQVNWATLSPEYT